VQVTEARAVPGDSVRAALKEVFARPEFDWQERADPFGFLGELWDALLIWLAGLASSHPVVYWLLVGAIAAVVLAILALLVHFGLASLRALGRKEESRLQGSVRPSRPRDPGWYLAEAERLRGAGRYTEALAHRFVALVLDLDRREALKFHPSKTPAEYRDELRVGADGRAAFGDLVSRLYSHLFGGVACGAGELEAFDRAASEMGGRVAAR
jgi:hypothetical protein